MGQKEISGHRKEVEKTFWGIYSLQVLSTCLAVTLYIVVCLLVPSMNNPIALYLALVCCLVVLIFLGFFRVRRFQKNHSS